MVNEEMIITYHADQSGLVAAHGAAVESLLGASDVFRKLFPNAGGDQSGHPGEEGRWTESLLVEYLKENLPSRLSVSTGFILDVAREVRSYQVDILIHDATVIAPILRYGDAVIVAPEAVVAAISVKHTLRQGTLSKELKELADIGDLCGRGGVVGPYMAIVAYEMDHKRAGSAPNDKPTFENFAASIARTYLRHFEKRSERPVKLSAGEIVESIISLDGYLLHASALAETAGSAASPRSSVSVVWSGPTDNWRYVLGVELIEGVTRRFNRRIGSTGKARATRSGFEMSRIGSLSIVCESRPPVL